MNVAHLGISFRVSKSVTTSAHIIESFHVTSYEANFASHHTCDCHVGFLLAWRGIGKHNKMPHYFYLVHTTISNYNRVTKISAHTPVGNFKSFCEVNQKFKHFCFFFVFLFFLYTTPYKRKPNGKAKSCAYICAYHIVQTLYSEFDHNLAVTSMRCCDCCAYVQIHLFCTCIRSARVGKHANFFFFALTGSNWQKWKRVFLTCPCHEIYRDEAVGLKSCKNTWKITIFEKMWNLGQYRENLIFCQ